MQPDCEQKQWADDGSPLLSVVIPYFNQPKELERALASLQQQCLKDLEIFVVDDASEAGCDEVVGKYRQQSLPVTILRQSERSYTLKARLRGMQKARGRWLAFIDADDCCFNETSYEHAVREACRLGVDILHYTTIACDADGQEEVWHRASPFADILEGGAIFSTWVSKGCLAHSVWNKLYSRRLYRRVLSLAHDIPIYRLEDFYLSVWFLFLARSYASTTLPVYKYTKPGGSHPEKAAARAVDALRMYNTLPLRLGEMGLGQTQASELADYLKKLIVINAGRMCRFLYEMRPRVAEEEAVDPETYQETVENILKYASVREFCALTIISNAANAQKLQKSMQTLLV